MMPFNFKVAALATGHRLALLAAAVVPVFLAAPAGAQLNEALQAQVQTDKAAAEKQKELDAVRERTQDAGARYAQATADAESLERYNTQLGAQVKSQEAEMASIERQLLEIETTNREVQPLMAQMVATLDQFVQLDVPFLLDERTARVEILKEMLPRADVPISEKYRKILEAYQIELDYGHTLDAYQGRLKTGAEERTVEFVRLGRVSLMYRTLDGADTGYWDAKQKKWISDPSYRDDIQQALRVARGQGAKELLIVPVPAPEVRS
jgi:sirohydrochlorin ferrochelatase